LLFKRYQFSPKREFWQEHLKIFGRLSCAFKLGLGKQSFGRQTLFGLFGTLFAEFVDKGFLAKFNQ